jgi:hypothetical protein
MPSSRLKRWIKRTALAVLAVVILFAVAIGSVRFPAPYSFIKSQHPVDLLRDGDGRWFLFAFPGDAEATATTARTDLIRRGFVEDVSERPWYKFRKAEETIIISEGQDIAVFIDGKRGYPIHISSPPIATETKVWVHEPGDSSFEYVAFKVKKAVLHW